MEPVRARRRARAAGPAGPQGSRGPLRPAGGKPRRLWLTLLKWAVIASLVGAFLLVGTVAFVWMYGRDPNLPNISSLSEYHPKQVVKIYDGGNRLIGEVLGPDKAKERRTYVPYEKIPPLAGPDAFVRPPRTTASGRTAASTTGACSARSWPTCARGAPSRAPPRSCSRW